MTAWGIDALRAEINELKGRLHGNMWYRRFGRKVDESGKEFKDLTVGEVLTMLNQCHDEMALGRDEEEPKPKPTLQSLYGDGHNWP